MRTRFSVALIAAVGFVGTAAAVAPAAHAESTTSAFATRLVQLVNSARADHGLRALTVTTGTSTVAVGWTQHLASVQALSHNPNLESQLQSHGSPDWTSYGENVGVGPTSSAQTLFNAYMNSPEHRANILGASYRYLGIGVVFTGSRAWNTMDFVDQYTGTTSQTTTSAPARHVSATTISKTAIATSTHTATRTGTTHTVSAPARRVLTHRRTAALQPVAHPHVPVHVEALASSLPSLAAPATVQHAAVTAAVPHRPAGRGTLPVIVAVWMIALTAARFVLARRRLS